MIKEEFEFQKIENYLNEKVDLLIGGIPNEEERSQFFAAKWTEQKKDLLLFQQIKGTEKVRRQVYISGILIVNDEIDITFGIPKTLQENRVEKRNVLLDLSGLEHVLIMFLTKVLVKQVVPELLFASYVRPECYIGTEGEPLALSLVNDIQGVKAVPGFVKRTQENVTLCTFVGFEGMRLKGIIESLNVEKLVSVTAFPCDDLNWYNTAIRNSAYFEDMGIEHTRHKCSSESIFNAIDLLREFLPNARTSILVPIGTRPHSMACAIYASHCNNVNLIFDHAVESTNRTQGVKGITIYHLSQFLSIKY